MKEIPLSVIVPVSKDKKLKECLASVDVGSEIVVVLNNSPSEEVVEIARGDLRSKLIFLDGHCNLANAFNIGVDKATNEKIVLSNSDCVFPPGLVENIAVLLDSHDVVKARVNFDGRTQTEYLVARLRHLFHHVYNDSKNLYGPGLGFTKKILAAIGGYLFDEDLAWGEDGELSGRIHKTRLDIAFTDGSLIHGPEKLSKDLRMAERIGRGKREKDSKAGINLANGSLKVSQETLLDEKGHFRTAYKQEGLSVALYWIVWRAFFLKGYVSKDFREYP